MFFFAEIFFFEVTCLLFFVSIFDLFSFCFTTTKFICKEDLSQVAGHSWSLGLQGLREFDVGSSP